MREVDVDVHLNKVNRTFNLAIKVLPTFDREKYPKRKFNRLLKFSKEVQIYLDIADPMDRLCSDLGYQSPFSRLYLGQFNAENDCLVMENLTSCGFVKYNEANFSSPQFLSASLLAHCHLVMQNIAQLHSLSLLFASVGGQALSELYPFAVEADGFRQEFQEKVAPVKETILKHLNPYCDDDDESYTNLLDVRIYNLFWKLVEMKAKPSDPGQEVFIHGDLNFYNVIFRYDRGQPTECKFLSLSNLSVSSVVMDLVIFLTSVLPPAILDTSHLSLLLCYHSHLSQICQQLGVRTCISLAELVKQFKSKRLFGSVINCKGVLGEYLLLDHTEEHEDVTVTRETRSLILSHLEDQCDCVHHKQMHFPIAQFPQVSDKLLSRRKSYIRVSSPDQCGRNI